MLKSYIYIYFPLQYCKVISLQLIKIIVGKIIYTLYMFEIVLIILNDQYGLMMIREVC